MEKITRAGVGFNWPPRGEERRREAKGGEGRRRYEEKHGDRGYSKRNKARGPWPSLIDHLHRQISSVLRDEPLFIQQSNNRFRSDFEPPRAECTRDQVLHIHTRSSAFRKFGDARIAAATCRFPAELPPLSVRMLFRMLASLRGRTKVRSRDPSFVRKFVAQTRFTLSSA